MKQLTRKEFLKTAMMGGLYLTTAAPNGRYGNVRSESSVRVGAHPWIYAAKLPGYDITSRLGQIFSDMSYAGMEGVELMHHPLRSDEATRRIGELKEKYDLPVIGTSYGADMWDRPQHPKILEDAGTVITNLAKVGGRTLGTSVGNAGQKKTPEQLDAQADLLKKLIALCEDNGVVLNVHNHTYEVEDNMHDLRGTLKRIPDLPLGPDINWLIRGGIDPVDFINRYGDKIVFLHLRDQYENGRWTEYLGQGSTDFAAIAEALRMADFSGDAIIELAHERDFERSMPLRESLKKSRNFVRSTMKW